MRDTAAGARAAADLGGTSGRDDVAIARLDLADVSSVDAFTAAWQGPLHVLVNNAGVMDSPQGVTAQGWKTQLGTNHLGYFALTTGLQRALAAAGDARVVSVSSSAHAGSPVVFDDLFFARRAYTPGLADAQSKTANVPFVVELTRRWAADGIAATAPQVQGVGGRYFEDCHEAQVVERLAGLSGVLPHALDPDDARRLWDVSEELLSVGRAGTAA